MRAGNKKQRLVVYVDKSLPEMSLEQKRWAYKHTLIHEAVLNKGGRIGCLDCGYQWKATFINSWKEVVAGATCARCGSKLKVKTTQKRTFHDWAYFTTIEVHKGFQVIRNYMIIGNFSLGKKRKVYDIEVGRIYINPNGTDCQVIGKYSQYSWSGDKWMGEFVLRDKEKVGSHNINSRYVYPKRPVIKKIRRNGFNQGLHKQSPYSLFSALLTHPIAETLMKMKQYNLLDHFISNSTRIKFYWSSIKITMKNNYMVKDVSVYLDYLDFLAHANRDLHSPKYICPENLHKEHDKYLDKKRRIVEATALAERIKKMKEAEVIYKKHNHRFFSLNIKKDHISIRAFRNVKQVQKESNLLEHCAFANAYHHKTHSLLLSVKYNKKPIETLQICLNEFKVLQARGLGNEPTVYSRKIIKIVKQNMNEIKMLHRGVKKPKLKKAV